MKTKKASVQERLEVKIAVAAFLDRLEKRAGNKVVMVGKGAPKASTILKPPASTAVMRPPKASTGTEADDIVKQSASETMKKRDVPNLLKVMGIAAGGGAIGAGVGYGVRQALRRWARSMVRSGKSKDVVRARNLLAGARGATGTGALAGGIGGAGYALASSQRERAAQRVIQQAGSTSRGRRK